LRFYTGQHRFYCGIDLHAATMYLCIPDSKGERILARLQRRHGKGKAPSILAHKIVRTVYCILMRGANS
jgi:hypothetical protein